VYCAGEEGSISAGPYYPFGTIGTVLRAYDILGLNPLTDSNQILCSDYSEPGENIGYIRI
jgi:hypothetical protein